MKTHKYFKVLLCSENQGLLSGILIIIEFFVIWSICSSLSDGCLWAVKGVL